METQFSCKWWGPLKRERANQTFLFFVIVKASVFKKGGSGIVSIQGSIFSLFLWPLFCSEEPFLETSRGVLYEFLGWFWFLPLIVFWLFPLFPQELENVQGVFSPKPKYHLSLPRAFHRKPCCLMGKITLTGFYVWQNQLKVDGKQLCILLSPFLEF